MAACLPARRRYVKRRAFAYARAVGAGYKRPAMPVLFRLIFTIAAIYALTVAALGVAYRFIPPATPLMVASYLRGDGMARRWVPLAHVSPHLIRAVLVSEDARFCDHRGIDWQSVEQAVREAARRRGGPRGASTISMQTAKNLFLWNSRSYLRKFIEAPTALWLDAVLPKRRMLEIYLNIAQWGKGVFGIEEAARRAFGVSAARLSPAQAALLATALPAPEARNAAAPGPAHRAMAATVQARAARAGAVARCVMR